MGGNYSLLITFLERTEVMIIQKMNRLAKALNESDWYKMKQCLHTIKAATGYVGAGRLHYVCYYIYDAYFQQNYQLMIDNYPLLIEIYIEFKRFSRKYLAEKKGKT